MAGLIFVLVALAVAGRNYLLLVIERAKTHALVSIMPGHNISDVQSLISTQGRALSPTESESAAFRMARATNTIDYWLSGGLMIRIKHSEQSVLEVEIGKLEFR